MVVCKFFQQGYCRFGQNCRFEHIYGSKFSYHANPPQQAAPAKPAEYTDEQLVNQMQSDIQLALKGGQWILSCYSPFKEKENFPGLSDLSPEEARLFIYEAKNSNNIEEAVTYMNNVFKETRQKYEQLLQPSVDVIKLLRSIYKGETVSSFSNIGQNTFSGTNDATSIFRRAVQNTPPASSIFAQGQQSIFNAQPDSAKELFSKANNTSIFGPSNAFGPSTAFGPTDQNNSVAKSIFSNAVQNTAKQFNTTNQPNPSSLFSAANQSIFGPSQTNSQLNQGQATSIFNQTQNSSPFSQAPNTSPFSQTQNSSPFTQTQNSSPFGPAPNTSPFSESNVFQKTESPSSIFGQANSRITTADNPGVYSKIEELSEDDLMAFKSERFELGFVPELPPPQQLCTRVQ